MDMSETGKLREKIVLCGANAYEQKYYFNPRFSKIPQSVQDELHIICVLFTRKWEEFLRSYLKRTERSRLKPMRQTMIYYMMKFRADF